MSSFHGDTIRQLRHEILRLQGSEKISGGEGFDPGLGPICEHFPNERFPVSAVHELVSRDVEGAATNAAWVSGLAGKLMDRGGVCLWIGAGRMLNPSGLASFGVVADRVVFVDVRNEREALWVFEECLKCEGLAAVVGEVREIDFTASRRLQLAVEKSRVTGFVLRDRPRMLGTNACAARWAIRPLPSRVPVGGMPGVGSPRWSVELMRVKNGRPGKWEVEWREGRFVVLDGNVQEQLADLAMLERRRRAG